MEVQTSFENVNAHYPEAVNEIMGKLRKGKSKEKNATPEQLSWHYFWGVESQMLSFNQMIAQSQRPKDKKDKTLQQRLKDMKPRIKFWVHAKIRRWWGNGIPMNEKDIPSEIMEYYRHTFVEEEKEKQIYDKKPQAQKDAEAAEALRQLRSMPGFIEIGIKR